MIFGDDRPGQLGEPIQIGAQHRIFAGAFRHLLQALELFLGVGFDLLGHFRFGDGFGNLRNLRAGAFCFTQLLMDGFELLA